MKSKMAIFGALLGLMCGLKAHALPSALPNAQCPSPDAIRYEGVHMAQPLMYNLFIIYQLSHYDTDRSWLFGIGLVTGDSMGDAIAIGNKLVQDISGKPLPTDDKSGGAACVYSIAGGAQTGIAVEAEYVKTPQELARFFPKG